MPKKFADGSGVANARMEHACMRSVDASILVARAADRLNAELDNLTPPGEIIRPPLDEDDSLMVAIREARAQVATEK